MRVVGYYAWHTFFNAIRKLFRKTILVVIAIIIGIGILFGVSAGIITSVVENNQTESVSEYSEEAGESAYSEERDESSTYGETDASEEDIYDTEESGADTEIDTEVNREYIMLAIQFAVPLIFIGFLLLGVYTGAKSGSNIFLMADVNLLFTAPLKPQSVLMFRLTFQMAATILGSVYLIFQIPNLVLNAGLDSYAIVAIFLAWIFLLVFQKIISVLSYTITATHEKLKKYVTPFIFVIIAVLAAFVGSRYLQSGRNVTAMMEGTFGNTAAEKIPVIGWYQGMIMQAVNGKISISLLYTGLLVVCMIVLFIGIWQIKADFYEDALSGAAARDDIMQQAKEGRRVIVTRNNGTEIVGKKRKKARREAKSPMKGAGASVFFWKEMYQRRRTARFGLVTNTMLTYFLAAVLVCLFCTKVLELSEFMVVGAVLAVIAFFRNSGNPIAAETSMNWLFLVPDSPYKKVLSAMLAGTAACAMDLIPAFIVGAVLQPGKPVLVLLWFVQIVTMDFMLSCIGVMLEVLLPTNALDVVKAMIQFMLKMVVLVIIVMVLVVGAVVLGPAIGLLLSLICNVIFGVVLFIIYPSLLHGGV